MTGRTFVDRCIRDDQGRIILWQNPNVFLTAFLSFNVFAWIFTNTTWPHQLFKILAFVSILIWCYLEIFRGVNYFRRVLGLIVLVLTLMAALPFIH